MPFILNRKQADEYFEKGVFFERGEQNLFLTFNNTILDVYDPLNHILRKNLFRPINQIVPLGGKLLISFDGGDISVIELTHDLKFILNGIIYEEDTYSCSYIRKISETSFIVYYGPFSFKIVDLDQRSTILGDLDNFLSNISPNDTIQSQTHCKSANSRDSTEQINLKSSLYSPEKNILRPFLDSSTLIDNFLRPTPGFFSFHSISSEITNISDLIVYKNLLYILFCPDHIQMKLFVVNLTDMKIIREYSDVQGDKLIRFKKYVVSVGKKLNFFFYQDLVLSKKVNISFNILNHLVINKNLILFTENEVYNVNITIENKIIKGAEIILVQSFFGYNDVIYTTQSEKHALIKTIAGSWALFQFKSSHESEKIKTISFTDLSPNTDLLKTCINLGISEKYDHNTLSNSMIQNLKILKDHQSNGLPVYKYRTSEEQYEITGKLIRKHKVYNLNVVEIGKISHQVTNGHILDSHLLLSNENTTNYILNDGKIVKSNDENVVSDEKTLLYFKFNKSTIQVTQKQIIIGKANFKIEIESVHRNSEFLMVRQKNDDLLYFKLTDLEKFKSSFVKKNVKIVFIEQNVTTFVYLSQFYTLEILKGNSKIFCAQLNDLPNRIDNCTILPSNSAVNHMQIDDVITFILNNTISIFIRCDDVVSIYKGLVKDDKCDFITKIYTIYSTKMLFTRDFIILDEQRAYIKETNKIIKINMEIDLIVTKDSSNQKNEEIASEDYFIAICDRKIFRIEFEKNAFDYTQKSFKIKNIDKMVHDKKNNVYVFTFLPKPNLKSQFFYFTELMTLREIEYANERQEIILATSNFNKLSSYLLPFNEYVYCLEILTLSDQNGDFSEFIVAGLSERCSDEVLKGRIVVFEVIDVVSSSQKQDVSTNKKSIDLGSTKSAENTQIVDQFTSNQKETETNDHNDKLDDPTRSQTISQKKQKIITKTKKALKLLASEGTKGTIQAISVVRGRIIAILATRVMVYEFDKNDGIQAVAFHDLYMSTTGLDVIKNFIVIADYNMGVTLLYFQSSPVKLHVLGSSGQIKGLLNSSIFYCNKELFIACIDNSGNLFVYSYSPNNILSNGGETLICRQSIKIFQKYYRIPENRQFFERKDDKTHPPEHLNNTKNETKFVSELKNILSFYSDQRFELDVHATSLHTSPLEEVLALYQSEKESLGVNLLDVREEICYKSYIDMEMVREFTNESIALQLDICERVGVKFEVVFDIIRELQVKIL
ncbi:mRNA cleavage and polyadenylation factor II complex, subunit CFT1 (CPSF subunit) [Pseudoloma neurophilia]|uniref:mRNA cleavage and polyadenylation factor II complex, subunit CFT1 (CPSF subunit) n=1 Tax=Pseudoloma neurophilia TaxID=146866 RepID=A0A0R0M106_9MICR|nr:mRNA cleavage and polyadenylation factor II complex, subunit CFT1 (CPSF subunit) [Pseudoloma neurophilia]